MEEKEAPRAIRDMIIDSWKLEDRHHILLVGEGGIGKTVAMLTLPVEDWFKKLGIPVIYVPLQRLDTYEGDLNRYIKEKIGSDNYERCIDLANRSSKEHPNLLLLGDQAVIHIQAQLQWVSLLSCRAGIGWIIQHFYWSAPKNQERYREIQEQEDINLHDELHF
ncbi:MAG: hypothetical protein Q4A32_07260 [Lachnospiraceae bacterium]|nr:hypothetical protein [Lachnospiraceae bacterium]